MHGWCCVQRSGWLVPQVALLHTWVGEDQCRVKPIQRCYIYHTTWAIIITTTTTTTTTTYRVSVVSIVKGLRIRRPGVRNPTGKIKCLIFPKQAKRLWAKTVSGWMATVGSSSGVKLSKCAVGHSFPGSSSLRMSRYITSLSARKSGHFLINIARYYNGQDIYNFIPE